MGLFKNLGKSLKKAAPLIGAGLGFYFGGPMNAKVQGERKVLKNILAFEDAIHSTYDALNEDGYDSSL